MMPACGAAVQPMQLSAVWHRPAAGLQRIRKLKNAQGSTEFGAAYRQKFPPKPPGDYGPVPPSKFEERRYPPKSGNFPE